MTLGAYRGSKLYEDKPSAQGLGIGADENGRYNSHLPIQDCIPLKMLSECTFFFLDYCKL